MVDATIDFVGTQRRATRECLFYHKPAAMYRSLLLLCCICWSTLLAAQLTPDDFITYGATRSGDGQCYSLTGDSQWEGGSIWYKTPIDLREPLSMELDMFFGCRDLDGADGMVLVLHPRPQQLGYRGEGMGFAGLNPALGIEMDTYQNYHRDDPAYDHLALLANGDPSHYHGLTDPVRLLAGNDNIEDCKSHKVRLEWKPGEEQLTIYIDGQQRLRKRLPLVDVLFGGEPLVHFGVTAATGGQTNRHEICFARIETEEVPALSFKQEHLLYNGDILSLGDLFQPRTALLDDPAELRKLSRFLQENPKLDLEISVHTAAYGTANDDQRLSDERRATIAAYLKQQGIDPKRVSLNAFGSKYGDSADAKSDRLEVRVMVEIP